MTEVSVRGAENLEVLAKRLKEAGRNDLRKELLRRIREVNKPIIKEIRENIREKLPSSGGLADEIARSAIGTRTRLQGKTVVVAIQARRGKSRLERLNKGVLRHPTYGHRPWVAQEVASGWFDEPILRKVHLIQSNIEKAMDDVAAKLTEGLD